MLGSCDLVAFVLTSNPARAKTFYSDTLGLKFVSQDDYAVVFDANGVMLRVTVMPSHTPTEHTVIGWNVPNIVATVTDLSKAGVKFEKYSFLEQDDLGIWSSPNGSSRVAWFKDPDGNVLSISQP